MFVSHLCILLSLEAFKCHAYWWNCICIRLNQKSLFNLLKSTIFHISTSVQVKLLLREPRNKLTTAQLYVLFIFVHTKFVLNAIKLHCFEVTFFKFWNESELDTSNPIVILFWKYIYIWNSFQFTMKGCCFCFDLRTGSLILVYATIIGGVLSMVGAVTNPAGGFISGCKMWEKKIMERKINYSISFQHDSFARVGWCTLPLWNLQGSQLIF